jgi:transcription antitermination factor NusG
MSASYAIAEAREKCVAEPSREQIREPQWFAVQTRYRFEKKVAAELAQKGCRVYLPLLTENHSWSDRQKEITIPLFPGYAFVHIDRSREARYRVLETVGLIGFVNFGGMIIPVPQKQIDDLQSVLRERGLFALHPFVSDGQRVRIRGGCLDGVEGVLARNDKGKLLISVEAIQRSIAIEIRGYELELA